MPQAIAADARNARHVREYKLLGLFAVIHAAIVFGLAWLLQSRNFSQPFWYHHVEVLTAGLSAVWFFWPIILALHVGRSKLRAYAALGLATAIFFLPGLWFFEFSGATLFAPDMLRLSPYDLGGYAIAYVRGWADARSDAKAGRLFLESYGFGVWTPGAPPLSEEVRARDHIEINQVANCGVSTYILGHASGYNRAAVREITRRFGPGVIAQAKQELAARLQRQAEMKSAGKAEAERDLHAGRLILRLYRSAIEGEADYRNYFRAHYQTDLERVYQAPPENADIGFRSQAYNSVMSAELRRRFGDEAGLAEMDLDSGRSYAEFLRGLEFNRTWSQRKITRGRAKE